MDISKSQIPGAGYGAFLTYFGARKLKDEVEEANCQLVAESEPRLADTKIPLRATHPGKGDVLVRLQGENLHGNHNCDYWPLTSLPLRAKIQHSTSEKKYVTVKLKGHDISEHACLANRPEDGVGFLGMNSPSDYVPCPGIKFKLNSCIDLGAYAPLSPTGKCAHSLW